MQTGEQWIYCSFGYELLGALIQNVTGVNAREYITKNILEPLDMKDSSFTPGPELGRRHLIQFEDDEKKVSDMINGVPRPESIWDEVPQTGGGLHTTSMDLSRFARMLCNGGRLGNVRILGKMAVEKMRTQYLFNVPDYCWGSNNKNRLYGMGPDLRRGDAIITSPEFFFHEGWGFCAWRSIQGRSCPLHGWCLIRTDRNGIRRAAECQNIIWSGLI
jgi:CubicO group peptidase (beta-lactamase class C family)